AGKIEQASGSYSSGLQLLSDVKISTQDLSPPMTKAMLLARLSELFEDNDQWNEALPLLRQSSALAAQIAESGQSTAGYRRLAVDALRKLAAGYVRNDDPREARSMLEQVLTQSRALESTLGASPTLERSIAETYALLSECFERLGRNSDAMDNTFKEFEIRKTIFIDTSSGEDFLMYLEAGNKLALVLLFRENNYKGAIEMFTFLTDLLRRWQESHDPALELERRTLSIIGTVASTAESTDKWTADSDRKL